MSSKAKTYDPNSPWFLTETQLAKRWNLSSRTLQRWRRLGKGPAFVVIEGRIRYCGRSVENMEQGEGGAHED